MSPTQSDCVPETKLIQHGDMGFRSLGAEIQLCLDLLSTLCSIRGLLSVWEDVVYDDGELVRISVLPQLTTSTANEPHS